MKVSELKREMDERFARVDGRFADADARLERMQQAMERKIVEEGEVTRRHFDIVAEQFKAEVRLTLDRSMTTAGQVATLAAINATEHVGFSTIIDDHEVRLKSLERVQSG